MSEVNKFDPFELPPIVMKKVTLSEVIKRLQSTITTDLMPSATGERTVMSKPTYFDSMDHASFLRSIASHCTWPGLYCQDKSSFGPTVKQTFVGIPLGDYTIAVDLVKLKGYVMRWVTEADLKVWEWLEDKPIAFDRNLLNEAFDNL